MVSDMPRGSDVRSLTKAEYLATMTSPMALVRPDDDLRAFPLGGYVDAIPAEDLQGHDFTQRRIDSVYRAPAGRFVHVLLAATTPNVFLAIVVDEPARSVHGHYLLNLTVEYELPR
jgi:hypothetical protein